MKMIVALTHRYNDNVYWIERQKDSSFWKHIVCVGDVDFRVLIGSCCQSDTRRTCTVSTEA